MSKRGIDSFFSSTAKKQRVESQVDSSSLAYDAHKSYPIPLPSSFPFDLTVASDSREINDKTDLDLLYHQPLFPAATAASLFSFLRSEFPWYRVTYQVRGMTINTPRFTTVFGLDSTHAFSQAGAGIIEVESGQPPKKALKCVARPIPGCLLQLKKVIESVSAAEYNFVLLNYYKDGTDSISYHSDDEHFLGPDPTIASISLGSTRDFFMRNKEDHKVSWKTALRSGDMVVMRGKTQAKWDHAVPKRKGKEVGGRINITFRKAVVRYGTENYYRYNVHDGPYYRWDEEQETMVLGSTWQPSKKREEVYEQPLVAEKTPTIQPEESFDVERAVRDIEAASSGNGQQNVPGHLEKDDSFDLDAQIKAIDEAVAKAQACA